MWLNKRLKKENTDMSVHSASVLGASENGLHINGRSQSTNTAQLMPFGVFSVPPNGQNAVVADIASRKLCLGVEGSPPEGVSLEAGEVLLYSLGGAYIHLKNNGTVVIKGTVIEEA